MNKSNLKNVSLLAVVMVLIFIGFKVLPSGNKIAKDVATVSIQSSTAVNSSDVAGVAAANAAKTISTRWQTSNYPTGAGVDINLIQRTNSSPAAFSFVRKVAQNTPNDGEETWSLLPNETGDLYVEVTCSSLYQFKTGCSINSNPIKL